MKGIGSLLFLFGAASVAFHLMGREVRLLGWIGNWGENVAWAIRGGLIVVGGAMFLLGSKGEKS